jgi:hypothetical protein
MIVAVLFVAIGVSDSQADSLTPIFTCSPCASTPTAPDVSLPPPLTIEVTWENTLFDFSLASGQPGDLYAWQGFTPPGFSQSGFASFTIIANGTPSVIDAPFLFQLDDNNDCLNCNVIDSGSLRFEPTLATSVPEPSSVVLILAGIGFLLMVMPKRLVHDRHVPDLLEDCPVELEPYMKKMLLILLHRDMEKIMPALPLVLSAIAVALTGLYQPASANAQTTTKPFYVGTCKPGKADFNTIQDAVTTVPPGSTINVCPGNYPEQVIIQQPLTLQGVQSGNNANVVITAALAPIANFQSQSFGPVAAQLGVLNAGGPVNISGLAVDGTGSAASGASAGIAFFNSSGTLNQVSQLLLPPNLGFVGVLVLAENGIAQTFSMKNSRIQGRDFVGIFMRGTADYDVENNYISLSAADTAGIDVQATGGQISGNSIDLQNSGFAGIETVGGSAITISGNSVSNVPIGVSMRGISVVIDISKNTFSTTTAGIQFSGDPSSTIKGNQFLPSPSGSGIDLGCEAPVISGNFFLGGAVGIANVPTGVSFQKKAGTFVNVTNAEQLCKL